jgi:hypothetical protein
MFSRKSKPEGVSFRTDNGYLAKPKLMAVNQPVHHSEQSTNRANHWRLSGVKIFSCRVLLACKKVQLVLGEEAAPKFRDSYIGKDSTYRPMYRLPKREACQEENGIFRPPMEITMTSLELVEFINANEDRESELRHDHFMAKVPKVIGEEMCEKFRTSLKDAYGRDQPGYRLPKREACLMAMS